MHTHVCIPQEKTESDVYIFLEYVSGGSISQMLRKFGAFSETMVGNFTAQIVDGLDYLHAQVVCVCACVCVCVCACVVCVCVCVCVRVCNIYIYIYI